MAMVNEKLLRLALWLVGLGALGALGWRIYDYLAHKPDYFPVADLRRLQESAGGGPRADPGHLLPWAEYAVIETLNVTGVVKQEQGPPPPPPEPKPDLSDRDLLLNFVQFAGPDHPDNAAWLQPVDDPGSEFEPPGDLYRVGQKVPLPKRKNLEVRLLEVREQSVLLGYGAGEAAGQLELTMASHDLPTLSVGGLLGGPADAEAATGVRAAPKETRFNEAGEFEVGTGDAAYFQKLSQEQLLAAVPVRSERDRFSNEVRGLRIQSVPPDSPFSRLGLRADDIVLEVNGIPAVNRDELLAALRSSTATVVEVKLERLGAVRTLTYRLP